MTDTRQSATADSPPATSAAPDNRISKPALWLGVLGIAFLFLLLRWNNFNAPLIRDEGANAYAAQLLLSGGLPYEQSFLQKPPMIAYSYALAELLAPGVFWFPRILAAVFVALATVLLGYIARREFGPGVAMPAMWLVTPMLLLPEISQYVANTEMFMILPLMATIAVYVRSRHGKGGPAHWLAAGCLAALTVCYKYTAVPLLAFVFAGWSFEEWRGGRSPRAIAGHWLAALGGGIGTAACVLAPFLLRDGGKRLWECTVVFNHYYAESSVFGLDGLWVWLRAFWHFWWILFLALGLLVFKFERRVWFWAALFLIAWLATAGSHYGQYYLPIMPFWALLVAVALRGFQTWIAAKAALSPRSRDALKLALTAGVVAIVCWSDAAWMVRTPQQFAAHWSSEWQGSPVFIESPLVAGRLRQLTTADDFVYVAGSEPQILYYAHRFSPTRFDFAAPLTYPTPLARGYQAEAIHALERHPPAAIVLVLSEKSWLVQPGTPPEFLDYLNKLLAEKYEIVGGFLSDGTRDQWQEPVAKEDVPRCTLALFKRKVP